PPLPPAAGNGVAVPVKQVHPPSLLSGTTESPPSECIFHVTDLRRAARVRPGDLRHIEAGLSAGLVFAQIELRRPAQALLLAGVHRLPARDHPAPAAELDLYKGQKRSVFRDQVDLAVSGAV